MKQAMVHKMKKEGFATTGLLCHPKLLLVTSSPGSIKSVSNVKLKNVGNVNCFYTEPFSIDD